MKLNFRSYNRIYHDEHDLSNTVKVNKLYFKTILS